MKDRNASTGCPVILQGTGDEQGGAGAGEQKEKKD